MTVNKLEINQRFAKFLVKYMSQRLRVGKTMHTAQYIMMLPGLECNFRINVLTIHNFKEMLHHTQSWKLKRFCWAFVSAEASFV